MNCKSLYENPVQSLKGSWICSLEQIGGYDVLTNVSFHVETVCLLSNRKSKPDSYVDLSINMEDYHRIKNEEK